MAEAEDGLDVLSDQLREALAWAQTIELGDDVGTRTLLIGMMRAANGASDVDELLRALDVSPDALYSALQDAAPEWRIDPYVPMLRRTARPPLLTPNVERALRLARASRPAEEGADRLESRHVFAALLQMPESTAYRGLARVLDGTLPMERVAALHRRWLERPGGPSFGALLRSEQLLLSSGTGRWPLSSGRVSALALSSVRLASARADGGVWMLDLDVPEERGSGRQLFHGDSDATALAFSPDARSVAAVWQNGEITVWTDRPGESLGSVGQVLNATSLAFAPDGRRIAVADAGGGVHLVSLDPDETLRSFQLRSAPLHAIAYPSDGHVVTVDGRGAVLRFDIETGVTRTVLVELDHTALPPAALSPNGRWLAIAPNPARVELHDLETQGVSARTIVGGAAVTAIAVSPDGRRFAMADEMGVLRLDDREPALQRRHHVEWLSDAHAREDLLGRKHLAAALAKRLDRIADTSPDESFLLHLDGPWGSGKSSILFLLRERLDRRWLIVRFDAWRQARVGPPWWALLTSLRKALRKDLGWRKGSWLRARETATRLRRDHGLIPFVVLMVLGLAAYLLVARDLEPAIALIGTLVAGSTLLLGPGRGAVAFLMWDSAMGARRYEQWHRDPMESLAEHFAWLVRRSRRPVVFFVDDLDRCDESYVVELLDAIQTLVRDPLGAHAPCFVVAADGRWIRSSYEQRHEHFKAALGEPGRPLGYLFLDKIFQLTVDVPAIGSAQQATYLRELLHDGDVALRAHGTTAAEERIAQSTSQSEIIAAVRDASPGERASAAAAALDKLSEPELQEATEHELERFAGLLERNPRSMKRFVNAYSMALSTMLLEGRDVESESLALWTIVRLRWPELSDRLRERPDRVGAFIDDALPPGDMDDPLMGLRASHDLQQILRFDGRPLTSEAIRTLTGA